MIDWTLMATVATPIACVFIGAFLNRALMKREKLITYYGHISDFKIAPTAPNTQDILVNTHSIIVKNNGKKTAKNVRLGHQYMPHSISVFPDTEYSINELPSGRKELVFPLVTPKKEITISYLYYSPVTYNQVNTTVESDEGPAKVVDVLLQPQPPRWLLKLIWFLIVCGLVAVVYVFVAMLSHAM